MSIHATVLDNNSLNTCTQRCFYFSPVSSSSQCCLSHLTHQILHINTGRARKQLSVPTTLTETVAQPVFSLHHLSFPPKFVAFCLVIMSVMKDITNLTSISSLNGHESSPERDIFVSFEAPSLRRKRTAKQASLHRFVQSSTETLENMSSEEESSNKSGSEVEGEANSVFMTHMT